MEVFATAITAGSLILQFLDACSAFSDEAKSLKIRFDWDMRIIKALSDYFDQRLKASQQLAPEDTVLLEQTASYLDGLVSKVQKNLWKIERKGWLHDSIGRAVWAMRRAELKGMQMEIHEWTKRFDVRLLGLPPELRIIIPDASGGNEAIPSAVVRSNNRLKEFLALTSNDKQTRAKDMILEDSDELASKITHGRDVCFQPLQYGAKQIIFASRKVPIQRIPGTSDFQRMASEMGKLAATLNCLDPAADIRLLKVEYYFYHAESNQFLFAQTPPYPIDSMLTLEQMIYGDPFPRVESSMSERFKLAYRIAEAVFFLHTAGFVHKNITSSSIVALRPSHPPAGEAMPDIPDSYLMGFDLIRGKDATTTKEGAIMESGQPRSIWDFEIFQHPDRLHEESSLRYIKTYDVYSLGVVLLEVGFWEPLKDVARDLTLENPTGWATELSQIVPELKARTGERYRDLVAWCLGLKGDRIVGDAEFMQRVLDPLEEIVNALSPRREVEEGISAG
jgi:hypothetical protein